MALRSARSSSAVRSRYVPGFNIPSLTGPILMRRSRATSKPTASHMRRIWRFFSLMDRNQKHDASRLFRLDNNVRRLGDRTIKIHSLRQPDQLFLRHIWSHRDTIRLVNMTARMHDSVGKSTIVGQKQQPFGVFVQSPDRIDPLIDIRMQIGDTPAIEFI